METSKIKGNKSRAIHLKKYSIYIVFVCLCIVLAIISPPFGTFVNFINILKQVSIIAIIAFGSCMILISGEIDLSSGAICALAGCASAFFGHPGEYHIIVPILMSLAVGVVFGLLNGVITAKGLVPSFIVTLGVSQAVRGLALILTNGATIANLSNEYRSLGAGYVYDIIPNLVFFLIGAFLIMFYIMEKTRLGRYIYAVGGNEKSAYLSGVNTAKIKIIVFMIAGAVSGFAGMLLAARINSGSPIAATGYELQGIAAAVIGGTSISGGIGRIHGTVVGALLLAVISNGLDLMGLSYYYQQIVSGAIIVGVVFMDIRGKKGAA